MTQLSGVASIIFSCLKMGMCSPMELNRPTMVAMMPRFQLNHLTTLVLQYSCYCFHFFNF